MKKNFDFKKNVLLVLIQIVCGIFLFAEDVAEEKTLTVKITNVASEDGQIILAIYNSVKKDLTIFVLHKVKTYLQVR